MTWPKIRWPIYDRCEWKTLPFGAAYTANIKSISWELAACRLEKSVSQVIVSLCYLVICISRHSALSCTFLKLFILAEYRMFATWTKFNSLSSVEEHLDWQPEGLSWLSSPSAPSWSCEELGILFPSSRLCHGKIIWRFYCRLITVRQLAKMFVFITRV